jgi:MFS family permease
MQSVAVGWQVYAKTGHILDLGYVGLAQFLPFLVFILPSGHVADRHDRRVILVTCNGVYLVGSILLLAYTLSGAASVMPIFGILALLGSARAFSMPAGQAILRNIVDGDAFAQAVAFNSTAFHVAVVIGPVLGGLAYLAGPVAVHGSVSVTLLLSTLLLSRVRARQVRQAETPITWHTALEGFRFVRSRPVILGAISLDLFAVLFGGATALLPAVVKDVLHADSVALGLLRASPALGAACMTIVLTLFPLRRRVGLWMFAGVFLFGSSTIVFGCSRLLWLSIASLFLTGVGDMLSVYIRQILVQTQTPDVLRGRVSAVSAVFIGASNELGEFESGVTAGWFGAVPSIVTGGIATLLVVLAWVRLFPSLRRMDVFPPASKDVA